MFDYVYEDRTAKIRPFPLTEIIDKLPQKADINSIAPLIWAEHCLECSAPECYSSCAIFEKNRYSLCKRTQYGVLSVCSEQLMMPGAQLKFRKWGKLRCEYNNQKRYPFEDYRMWYSKYRKRRDFLFEVGKPFNFFGSSRKDALARFYHHKCVLNHLHNELKANNIEEELALFFYSFEKQPYQMILDAVNDDNQVLAKFSKMVIEGLNIWLISTGELQNREISALELHPDGDAIPELTFFLSDLVTFSASFKLNATLQKNVQKPAQKAKCVVWDLDNTIWSGVVGECGADSVQLNGDAVETIKALDERGIVQSICSKNDFDPAWQAIQRFGLDEYFLYPQINWNAKSENLLNLSKKLNINLDSFVEIDDSEFERNEIRARFPCVRAYSEKEIPQLLSFNEFDLPITDETRKRRLHYKNEEERNKSFAEGSYFSYEEFLRSCRLAAEVSHCSEEDLNRCSELLMRTNQLNASTNRIAYDELLKISKDEARVVLKVTCRDKYGDYGTVGCLIASICEETVLITDFVLSCRVAKKKLESALIYSLSGYYCKDLDIVYYPSERNKVLKNELLEIGGKYDEPDHRIRFSQSSLKNHDLVNVTLDI